jgi:hypothetical protein
MAKTNGLGATVEVDDATSTLQNISNDITNYACTMPRATQDITGINKYANETLLLLQDYTVTLNGVFNTASDMSHEVFSTIPSTSVLRSVSIAPTSNPATPILAVNCYLTDYQLTRDNTGNLTWQVPGQLGDGNVPTWA